MPITGTARRNALFCEPALSFAAASAASTTRPLRAGWLASTALFLALFLAVSAAHAHEGGLNKDGCHHERKTGASLPFRNIDQKETNIHSPK